MNETVPNRQHPVKTERSPAGRALSELVVRVFRLDGLLTAAGDALAEPAGQTTARWRVLAAVEQRPLTVAQIARAWSLARQSVQRVADLLEQDGLVTYEENPAHRRAKLVCLTPSGRTALARIQAAQLEWANALGARIGVADLRAANAVLERVLDALR
jgi:DNA-binding MarR family transcriptional regulator